MAQMDYEKNAELAAGLHDYARDLSNGDKIRLAAYVISLANAIQQEATISQDAMWHARECTTMFDRVERDDPMEPGYHLHNMLDNLSSDFDELAEILDTDVVPEQPDPRAAALAKLTDAEKKLLGLPV